VKIRSVEAIPLDIEFKKTFSFGSTDRKRSPNVAVRLTTDDGVVGARTHSAGPGDGPLRCPLRVGGGGRRALGREVKNSINDAHEISHPLEPRLRDIYGTIFFAERREGTAATLHSGLG
jgi:L-alanine-DL-glutamate epimerase-like enolase superfamily enzyme